MMIQQQQLRASSVLMLGAQSQKVCIMPMLHSEGSSVMPPPTTPRAVLLHAAPMPMLQHDLLRRPLLLAAPPP